MAGRPSANAQDSLDFQALAHGRRHLISASGYRGSALVKVSRGDSQPERTSPRITEGITFTEDEICDSRQGMTIVPESHEHSSGIG